ncbi:sugar kinase [Cognatishimia sp.]|uniref:sugar kinase n=1 Tax=Cognatishimia sp. TaxID=2211648 RepID=UPI003518A0BC
MISHPLRALAIGEAMIEMAPIEDGVYRRGFAGDTFNTAWHMAQLLGHQNDVGFVSAVGTDASSDAFVNLLGDDGLDAACIARVPDKAMGLYMIDLDGVERSFQYWRSDSAARQLASNTSWLSGQIKGAGLIHLSGISIAILPPAQREDLLETLLTAQQNGALISFDPNLRPALWTSLLEIQATMVPFLKLADICLPSFDDEAYAWGDKSPADTIKRLSALGVQEVVVKNGASSLDALIDGTTYSMPTPSVTDIVDTTGAGDAFNAGFLVGKICNLGAEASLQFGQRMAAEVIKHYGARIPKDRARELSPIKAA